MAGRSALKLVPDEPAEVPAEAREGESITTAAASGDQLRLLVALRRQIASDLDAGVPARDLASLSKRLVDISAEIEDLKKLRKGDEIGEAARTPDEAWEPE